MEEKVNLNRVMMCHLNPGIPEDLSYHKEIAKRWAYLEFEFGHRFYYKSLQPVRAFGSRICSGRCQAGPSRIPESPLNLPGRLF